MSKTEVLSMLKFGADRIFKNDAGRMPTDEELDSIISRTSMIADQKGVGEGTDVCNKLKAIISRISMIADQKGVGGKRDVCKKLNAVISRISMIADQKGL